MTSQGLVPSVDLTFRSMTDLSTYNLPDEHLFGDLRSSTEFQRLEKLGEGTSGYVYKVKDNKNNKFLAMKCLRKNHDGGTLSLNHFREITVLQSLNHKNIINLIHVSIGASINDIFLVFELCQVSLDKYIDSTASDFPHSQLKSITRQMFSGLSYLHKNHVIHRDIKTSNLMITGDGIIKIIDFGLTRRLTYDNMKMTHNVMTRWYEPPEILLEAPDYGTAADMWSAACVFGEVVLRRPLLKGESQINQINLVIDLIGTPTPNVWPDFVKCSLPKSIKLKSQSFNRLHTVFEVISTSSAMDILTGLFVYDPKKRLTAEECAQHDWYEMAPFPSDTVDINTTRRV